MSDGDQSGGDLVSRWEQRTTPLLIVLTVLFLIAYAIPIVDPTAPEEVLRAADAAQLGIWAVFIADYAIRLGLAGDKTKFLTSHLLDLITVVVPVLRPLRLIRLLALVTIVTRRIALNSRTARVTAFVATTAMFLWLIGALAVTEAERADPDANISSFNDGVWWAITTMTTVGYGDRYPVTAMGKVIGMALMLTGLAVAAVATAAVASWFVERFQEVEENLTEEIDSSQKSMAALEAKLDLLLAEIANLREERGQPSAAVVDAGWPVGRDRGPGHA